MNGIFKKLLSPRQTEYLVTNHNLIIQEISPGVQPFAETPSAAVSGTDARTAFPELIGIENILMSIVLGAKPSFEFKGVARFTDSNNPLYFDILAVPSEEEHSTNKWLGLFEDTAEKMVMKQSLVQKANEENLLLSALTAARDYVDKIIRSMGDALLVTTTQGTIKTANEAAQLLFGYSELELRDLPLSAIVVEEELLYPARHQYILSQKATSAEKTHYLEHVKSASKHMVQLLDDLRLLSSAEAGQRQFNPAPLDLPKFCTDLVEGIKISYGKNHAISFVCERLVAPDKKIDSSAEKTQKLPVFDKKLLRHILTNLLGNAVKYSQIDSNIYFELNCSSDREVTFKIKDEGIGIPAEDQPQLFEFYYRAENVGKIPGTGLGLPIVKQCVELHGGQIEFVSKVGVGTTFKVTIPCYRNREND